MGVFHKAGIDPKLYRLWFLLNSATKIQIKTALGLSEVADVGEIIGQGSSGGAIVRAANLDEGVNSYFSESDQEAHYGNIRLQPIIYQDDVARLAMDVSGAQKGNVMLSKMANTKQLEMHEEKTGVNLFGSKK